MMTAVSRLAVVVVALTMMMCVGEAEASSSKTTNATSPCMCLEKVTGGLRNPLDYVSSTGRDNSPLALVVEQRGVVRAFDIKSERDLRERKTPFLDITDRVRTSNATGEERGLLGLALHPDYSHSRKGRVFVYYIAATPPGPKDYAYLSEFQATNDVVDVTSEQQLLRIKQPSVKGNGGQLLFGEDGYLYIFTGDGTGHAGQPGGHAQDLQSFLGKALRIDVNKHGFTRGDSASALLYDTPDSNPFYADPEATPEVFALGFRNPWRCSQDSRKKGGTGDIYCGDVGSDFFEEINVIQKGGNYGWNLKEGDHCIKSTNCSDNIENEGTPLYSFPHSSEQRKAVVGGFVYRGKVFRDLNGSYAYGNAVSGQTFLLNKDRNGQWSGSTEWPMCPARLCPCHARHAKLPFLLAFGLHTDDELMLLMTSQLSVLNNTGTLFRIAAPTGTGKKPVTCSTCNLTAGPLMTFLLCVLATVLRHDACVKV